MNVCRVCCENNGITDIFDETNALSQKIMYCCANIGVSENDGLPHHLCRGCEEELAAAYCFVLKVEAADTKLRSPQAFTAKVDEYEFKQEMKLEPTDNVTFEDHFDSDSNTPVEMNKEQDTASKKSITSTKFKKCKFFTKRSKQKGSNQLQCKDCGQQFKNNSVLMIHMRKHSEHRPFECTLCDKKYKDVSGLKRHRETNHNYGRRKRKFICEACGKAFFTKSEVVIHNRTHSGETPYECEKCLKKFTQIGSLARHRVRVHTGDRNHSCPKCTKTFLTKEDVRRHMVVHSNIKKFVCTICNVPFKYANNLRKHVRLHSQTTEYVCDYCLQTFNTKGNLSTHITRMHSDKSGFCGTCFKSVANIETHMYKHNGKTPYKCELCSSSFSVKGSLTHHMNFRHKHTDKYMCSVSGCTETFPSKPMLAFHVAKYHESRILFPCDRCSKGFYRKSDLSRHMLHNHREKPEL